MISFFASFLVNRQPMIYRFATSPKHVKRSALAGKRAHLVRSLLKRMEKP